jgi:hypothetical protein
MSKGFNLGLARSTYLPAPKYLIKLNQAGADKKPAIFMFIYTIQIFILAVIKVIHLISKLD